MEGVDAATKAALALGAFGSLLGLLNFGLKGIEVWRDRSNVRLSIHTGSGAFVAAGKQTLDLAGHVYIRVTNRGRRPVKITSAGFVNGDHGTFPLMVDSLGQHVFPVVLDERNPSISVDVPTDAVREGYSRPGQAPPTGIFCHSETKRHTRRLNRNWVRFLTSPPSVRRADASADAGPGGGAEDGEAGAM